MCQQTCEAERVIACMPGQSDVTLTPDIGKELDGVCGAAFNAYVSSVNAACSNAGNARNETNIQGAWNILVRVGYYAPHEINGVTIRWCDMQGLAQGMVPDRDIILLDHSNLRTPANILAPLLGHEMLHVRQIRSMGTDNFKCSYSKELLAGRGTKHSNYLEREGYELESKIRSAVEFPPPPSGNFPPPPVFKDGERFPFDDDDGF